MQQDASHIPVLLDTVLHAVNPQEDEMIIDATFGAGGYSRAVLNAAPCRIIAIDRDPHTKPYADALRDCYADRFTFRRGQFGAMAQIISDIAPVDAIMLDIGVSSMQLDQADRGFSFRQDAPLDMRMSSHGQSAADIIATSDEAALTRIFREYGEERAARRIARHIVAQREVTPITRTVQLAELVASIVPAHTQRIHPATRIFQALRIAVNHELDELRATLKAAPALLSRGGRLVVVTFHSLEDRLVKQAFRRLCEPAPAMSRHIPAPEESPAPEFAYIYRKAVTATDAECNRNPRARSAKCRAIRRISEAAYA